MAKIKYEHKLPTATYNDIRRDSYSMGERNDCTVVAVSILCDVSYLTAHNALREAGRKKGCGAYRHQTQRAIESLGFIVHRLGREEIKLDYIANYPGAGKNLKNVTTHHPVRYKKFWDTKSQNCALFTPGHVAAYKDGMLHDWSRGHAKRVEEIWIVTKR